VKLTYTDSSGDTRIQSWALPLVVAAICVPIVLAILIGVLTVEGTGPGLAAGALVVATLIVLAVRARPRGKVEVAPHHDPDRRVLVVATVEPTPSTATRVAELAGEAADVRLLVPVQPRRIDRWLSAEDQAREDAERTLAHSAGTLVAAGLPVSGSVGDSDASQALEDELRAYPADEVILLAEPGGSDELGDAGRRLALPLERVEVPPEA
jgi:hypothetical protein